MIESARRARRHRRQLETGQRATVRFATLDQIDVLITDDRADDTVVAAIEGRGVDVRRVLTHSAQRGSARTDRRDRRQRSRRPRPLACGDWSAPPTKSSPTDIVTQTDLESEALIKARLAVATPDSGFVGEEGGATEAQRRLQWIVDPLDGTVNFWYGLPVVAVSIAATIDGVVRAAAVVDVRAARDVFRGRRRRRPSERGADHGVDMLGTRSGARHDRLLVPSSDSRRPRRRRRTCVAERAATCGASDRRHCKCVGWPAAVRTRTSSGTRRSGTMPRHRSSPGKQAPSSSCPARRTTAWRWPAAPGIFDELRRLVELEQLISSSTRRDASLPSPRHTPMRPAVATPSATRATAITARQRASRLRIDVAMGGEVGVDQRPAQLG